MAIGFQLPGLIRESERIVVPSNFESRESGTVLSDAVDELIDVDFRDHFRAAIFRDSHYEDSECFKSITTFRLEKLNKPSIFDFQICVVIKFIFYSEKLTDIYYHQLDVWNLEYFEIT